MFGLRPVVNLNITGSYGKELSAICVSFWTASSPDHPLLLDFLWLCSGSDSLVLLSPRHFLSWIPTMKEQVFFPLGWRWNSPYNYFPFFLSWREGGVISCRITCFMMFEKYVPVFCWHLFSASSVDLCCPEGQPRLTWAVTDFRAFKECLSAVGYAWMLERNLTIHFKNITPTEIAHRICIDLVPTLPFLVTLLPAPSIVVEESCVAWLQQTHCPGVLPTAPWCSDRRPENL